MAEVKKEGAAVALPAASLVAIAVLAITGVSVYNRDQGRMEEQLSTHTALIARLELKLDKVDDQSDKALRASGQSWNLSTRNQDRLDRLDKQ